MNAVNKSIERDIQGRELNILEVSNGRLSFTLIPERSLDIGDIYLDGEKISWNREKSYLKHPDSVDLKTEGFEPGFYAAVTSLGPEVFGTPDEVRTVHGTGAYSMCRPESIKINITDDLIEVSGTVDIKGYTDKVLLEKEVRVVANTNSLFIERTEVYHNLSGEILPLDDAYHIQLCGDFVSDGGRYVLPVKDDRLLLRDSAPEEANPRLIYPFDEKLDPIRCYQYIPERVRSLTEIEELTSSKIVKEDYGPVTAEMIVNKTMDKAAVIVRPLSSFSRTLLAKRNIDGPMYAIEPCKTRPNSIKQKAIDGELHYIYPDVPVTSHIMIAILDNKISIELTETKISRAGDYEKYIERYFCKKE